MVMWGGEAEGRPRGGALPFSKHRRTCDAERGCRARCPPVGANEPMVANTPPPRHYSIWLRPHTRLRTPALTLCFSRAGPGHLAGVGARVPLAAGALGAGGGPRGEGCGRLNLLQVCSLCRAEAGGQAAVWRQAGPTAPRRARACACMCNGFKWLPPPASPGARRWQLVADWIR